MRSPPFLAFCSAYNQLINEMRTAPAVKTERWQGVPVNRDTRELQNVVFEVDLDGIEDLVHWRADIAPNLPWADDHFAERVGGEPLNPGKQWKNWPYARSAEKALDSHGRFNHTYMQRLWPQYAGRTPDGRLPRVGLGLRHYPASDPRPKYGIAHGYGDLQSLVELLASEPYTRQAWIPLFFPEDTGVGDRGRKMCSLGYQVTVRDGRANLFYPLRSCDLTRHFKDDCYLGVRMLLWIIDRCREKSAFWGNVKPGTYAMWMTSLHVFKGDV